MNAKPVVSEPAAEPLLPRSDGAAAAAPTVDSAAVSQRRREAVGYFLVFLAAAAFSIEAALLRAAESRRQVSTLHAVFVLAGAGLPLSLISLVVLSGIEAGARLQLVPPSRAASGVLVARVVSGLLGLATFAAAIRRIPAGEAASIAAGAPALVVLLGPLVGEPVRARDGVAVVLATVGVALVSLPEAAATREAHVTGTDRVWGTAFALLTLACNAALFMSVRWLGKADVHPVLPSLCVQLGTLISFSLLRVAPDVPRLVREDAGAATLLAFAGAAMFGGQILAFFGMARAPGGPSAIVLSAEVPMMFGLGVAFLGETVAVVRCFGAVLVIVSSALVAFPSDVDNNIGGER